MNRRALLATATAFGLTTFATACNRGPEAGNLLATATAVPSLSTFVSAVQTAELSGTVANEGPFTLFVPSNAAFAALPPGTLDQLSQPENRETLINILAYHAIRGTAPIAQFSGQQLNVVTAIGQTVRVDGTNGVRLNNANVIRADIPASNGIIHVIDQVLIPE